MITKKKKISFRLSCPKDIRRTLAKVTNIVANDEEKTKSVHTKEVMYSE